jgi:NADPH-dependent curcumin reductase CurA
MVAQNRRWVLARRPTGIVGREHFEWQEAPIPSIGEGEFLVRNLWLSCDPTQRGWIERDTYVPMLPLGEVMASFAAGEVVESKHPDFMKGDLLSGGFGWQDYAVSDAKGFGDGLFPPQKIPPGVDIPTALSLFGNGLTSYFGLLDVGQPNAGDTVLVSAAAGAVGSIACQIAKLKGCRVVGIAGGQRKCDWLRDELGVDAIDYKGEDVQARLGELCPTGVDVFFDNVGGEILDAGLASLAPHARVVVCGAISVYSDFEHSPGIKNYINLVVQRASMRGFLIFDFLDRATEAIEALAAWASEGKVKATVDVVEGLENAPDALRRLFTGENLGKQLVKIADR